MMIEKRGFDENMAIHQKAGQLFFAAAYINDDDQAIKETEKLITDFGVGGLIFFHSRISANTAFEGPKTVVRNEQSLKRMIQLIQHYQSLSKIPLIISIDAEWGLSMRVENTPKYPYAVTLGALTTEKIDLIFEVGKLVGNDLKKAGVHLNMAPVVDINDNPKNPVIGYRSFGSNKEAVAEKAYAFYQGMKASGVSGCYKHFPGHGNTYVDSHLGLPIVEKDKDTLYSNELFPFIHGVSKGIDAVMIAHLAMPALTLGERIPATLSSTIIKGILRDELGFEGLVISDALNMKSVSEIYDQPGILEWKALEAGNDVLCFSQNIEAGIEAITKNSNINDIDLSVNRIQEFKIKAGLFSSQPPVLNPDFIEIHKQAPGSLIKEIGENIITVIKKGKQPIEPKEKITKLSFYPPDENHFFDAVNLRFEGPEISMHRDVPIEMELVQKALYDSELVLISFFVAEPKSVNNFGIEMKFLELIGKIAKAQRCILYWFGSPYALSLLPNLEDFYEVILMYEGYPEFQKAAAEFFLGNLPANGQLPADFS